jgi:DNA processing protein
VPPAPDAPAAPTSDATTPVASAAAPPTPIDDRERAAWVAFNRTPGIGVKRVRLLLDRFGSLAAAWAAPLHEVSRLGFDRRVLDAIADARGRVEPERELERVRRLKATVLTLRDPDYPERLAAIPGAPPVLYLRGGLTAGDGWSLAVVGTRRPTLYGRDTAQRLAGELAAAGVTIVSGLAKGIDTHAHRGALAAGGRTIAVLGHGIDTCYPPENRRLAAEIAERGAVVTEYAAGVGPLAENFPPRNRIIAGLAAGVLVVEAGETSGALITSRYAGEQGRDCFAVPGPITSPASRGCHKLIQDGAKLVTSADDVLWELNPHLAPSSPAPRQLPLAIPPPTATPAAAAETTPPPGRTPTATGDDGTSDLLQHLSAAGEPLHVDVLARLVQRPVHEVTAALALLEVHGAVRHAGAMRYAPTR